MLTKLQQNGLITYITTCKGGCECYLCEYFGGAKNMFEIFSPDDFTEIKLRKIWSWLKRQYLFNGTCDLMSLNFNDPIAPKNSDITQCHLDSYAVGEKGNHLTLKQILMFEHISELFPAAVDRVVKRSENPAPPIPDDMAGQIKWVGDNL